MDWEIKQAEDKLFWHITNNRNKSLIEKGGILQSQLGQNGKGVYCIESEDYEVLDGIIELMEQKGTLLDDLIIVEFYYSGEYKQVQKEQLITMNEGWVVIEEDISSLRINKIKKAKNI